MRVNRVWKHADGTISRYSGSFELMPLVQPRGTIEIEPGGPDDPGPTNGYCEHGECDKNFVPAVVTVRLLGLDGYPIRLCFHHFKNLEGCEFELVPLTELTNQAGSNG